MKTTRNAEDEYLEVKSKRRSGERIFDVTFHTLLDEWLEGQEKLRIEKTKGRYDTIKSQVGWIKKFIPDQNFKIKDITPSLFLNYYTFRKKQTKDKVQNVTLINENQQSTQIFKFGIRMVMSQSLFLSFLEFKRM